MNQFRKIKVNLLAIVSLMLIAASGIQIVNKSIYTHSHVIAFGQVVTHAHPFEKQDSDKPVPHRHTQAEMLILDQVFNWAICFLAAIVFGLFIEGVRINSAYLCNYIPITISQGGGRSPPYRF